jgi:3-hydroxyisobutyrate dehydrogenase
MEKNERIHTNYLDHSLADLEQDCWSRLVTGAVKSRTPFHTPSLATLANGEVSLRTVVLRKTLPEERELRFHTDIRSPKWNELLINPSMSALFYDASERIQLRVKGKTVLHHTDDMTAKAWQTTSLSSRKCYLTQFSPSSFTDSSTSGLTEAIEYENFTLEDSEVGYENFGIVSIHVQSIDWLWLNHAGHRRAFFDYEKGVNSWMVP